MRGINLQGGDLLVRCGRQSGNLSTDQFQLAYRPRGWIATVREKCDAFARMGTVLHTRLSPFHIL